MLKTANLVLISLLLSLIAKFVVLCGTQFSPEVVAIAHKVDEWFDVAAKLLEIAVKIQELQIL